jgi:hypothetical protein
MNIYFTANSLIRLMPWIKILKCSEGERKAGPRCDAMVQEAPFTIICVLSNQFENSWWAKKLFGLDPLQLRVNSR